MESFEDDWLLIISWLRLNNEVLQLLEARIIEFVVPILVQNIIEFLRFKKVGIMDFLIVLVCILIFR